MSEPVQTALLTKQDLPEIIQRYVNGESMQTLAQESGTHRMTLYRWMLSGCGDLKYESIVTDCLINRIADADEGLDKAPTICDIARAREKARYARMDFERRRPHLYGPKQEVKTDATITVIVQRAQPAPVTISSGCTEVPTLYQGVEGKEDEK